MNNQEKALTPHFSEIDLDQFQSMGDGFDNSLWHAGQAANAAFRHDVYSDYRAICRSNTLRRHDYDLRSFSAFLGSFGVQRSPEALASDPVAWRGMTYGILAAFRRWRRGERRWGPSRRVWRRSTSTASWPARHLKVQVCLTARNSQPF